MYFNLYIYANVLHRIKSVFLPVLFTSVNFSMYIDSGVIRWVRNNLSQCVQLSLELSWTSVLHAALSSDNATKQLKQTRYLLL